MSRQAGARATVRSEIGREFVFIPAVTTALPAAPDTYLTLDLGYQPPGQYTAVASYFIGTNAANTTYWFDVWVNGAGSPIGAAEENLIKAGVQAPRSTDIEFPWPGGPVVLTHVFAVAAGPGTITLFRSLQVVSKLVKL